MIEGRVAIVTGGSRGIGAAIAKELAGKGCNIAILDVGNMDLAEALCKELETTFNVKAACFTCDVSNFDAAKEAVAAVKKEFGTVDILINNAGITRDGLLAMMKEPDWDAVLNVNLKGAFNMIRHTSSIFMKNRYGRIVNISSVAGVFGNAGQINYSASKAGLIGLTKTVCKELGSRNITCNAVAPGLIATDMTKDLGIAGEELKKAVPLGTVGTVEDVAKTVAFLADSDYISGEVIRIDGGMAC